MFKVQILSLCYCMTYTPKKEAKYSISYLTTCQNRTWQLKQTLHLSIENSLSYTCDVQFVLLDYYSTDDLHKYVHEELKEHLDSGKLVYIDANSIYPRTDSVTFDRSKAKNMVAKSATGDILCWLDADNIALQGFSEYINDCFCFNTDIVLQGDFRIAHDVGGRIVCMRSDYERTSGYDESLVGYNHEDVKFVKTLVESLELKRLFIHKRWLEDAFVCNRFSVLQKNLNYAISNKILVLIIFYNCFDYLDECIESIVNQNYTNFEIFMYNDGSTDNSEKICNKYSKMYDNFHYIYHKTNEGPASARYNGFNFLKNYVNSYNDIILQIDGDDFLCTKNAFKIINDTYNTSKCNVTFGSMIGKYSNGVKPINLEDNNFKKTWLYDHPRSFIAFFLNEFDISLFTMNSKYLTRYTDRLFMYHVLERSGYKNIRKIPIELYNYRSHSNNLYKNPKPEHKLMFEYVQNSENKKLIDEIIHIVVCSFKRTTILENFIQQLNKQETLHKIQVHIICNDEISYNWYMNNKKHMKFEYKIYKYNNKNFGFERFLFIKNVLLIEEYIPYVIIIDDDLLFNDDFIQKLYDLRQPKHYICTYGKIFNDNNYWIELDLSVDYFDYGGTGGCILDTNIFKNEKLFEIKDNSILYIEDLWLSYIIHNTKGWKIKNSKLNMKLAKSESMLSANIRDEKQKLLDSILSNKFL